MKNLMSRLSAAFSIACLGFAIVGAAQAPEKSAKSKEAAPAAQSTAKKPDKPVDINNATEKELTTLPGVGAKQPKKSWQLAPSRPSTTLRTSKGLETRRLRS